MISLDVIWWIVFARLTNHATGRVVVSIFMVAMMVGLIARSGAAFADRACSHTHSARTKNSARYSRGADQS